MENCLCGKPAVATAYIPMENVFAGLKQVTEPHMVCDYHAQKSIKLGYRVEYGGCSVPKKEWKIVIPKRNM